MTNAYLPHARWLRLASLCILLACDSASSPGQPADPGLDTPGSPDGGITEPNKPGTPGVEKPEPGAQSFESDLPGAGVGRAGAGFNTLTGASPNPPVADASAQAGAERAIVEADIIQTEGNRLYALSRVAGLSIIDIADPAKLTIVGRFRELRGTPFEMYLRDGVALVMFSDWGQYTKLGDDQYQWVQTSKVVALDVANPAAIARIGSFDVAGDVSDSRIVGDVLYVVGYQNGSCWGCDQKPLTSVQSLNVKNVRAISKVDELKFENTTTQSWGKRSISVNTSRIYVAGPEWGAQPTGSTIQAIDITDPAGDLVPGATVRVDGQINNRWQMDEYQGTLRVVSQPWQWWNTSNVPPTVQTFTVASSQQINTLGRTSLVIPPGETLESVRFDGVRGYAITARRQTYDPLFTIDLSIPAFPRQVGELDMPGFVYHMEPRGDRVVGLGFDQGNPAGGIAVSLFDVSNMAAPRMLSRVNFGGTWGRLPEDQDRIHKAFRVLDALGLILVPFSGWEGWTASQCDTPYRSGVKLIDFANDKLTARGEAPSRGEARRAIVHGANLLTVSDEAVDSFSLANRDKPAALGALTLARNVVKALPISGSRVARINQDWYTNKSTIDLVNEVDVERADVSLGALSLSEALQDSEGCATNAWVNEAFVAGSRITLTYSRWYYRPNASSSYVSVSGVLTVDVSTNTPRVLDKLETVTSDSDGRSWYGHSSYYDYGYYGAQKNVVHTPNALALLETKWVADGANSSQALRLRVVDLRDPSDLSETTVDITKIGSYAGLVQDGHDVLLSHYELSDTTGRARFYLERIALSNPEQPSVGDPVNVPGALLHVDPVSKRAVMVELVRSSVADLSSQECWERFGYAEWQSNTVTGKTTCTGYQQRLHLVRFVTGGAASVSSELLKERDRISSSALADGRMAAIVSHGFSGYWWAIADCFGPCPYYARNDDPTELLVLGGFADDELQVGRAVVRDNSGTPWWGFWGTPDVYVANRRALVAGSSDVVIVDLADPRTPELARTVPLYGFPHDMTGSGNHVLMALGMQGVQRIGLSP